MSKHNHTLSINRDIYISGIFLKLRINWPFFSNIIYIYIESIDKSNRKHNFFSQKTTHILVIYVSGMKYCLKMIPMIE